MKIRLEDENVILNHYFTVLFIFNNIYNNFYQLFYYQQLIELFWYTIINVCVINT